MGVLESELMLDIRLSYASTMGALYSHQSADIEKGAGAVKGAYLDALSTIPYLTDGKTGQTMMKQERTEAVDRFNKMRNSMVKKTDA